MSPEEKTQIARDLHEITERFVERYAKKPAKEKNMEPAPPPPPASTRPLCIPPRSKFPAGLHVRTNAGHAAMFPGSSAIEGVVQAYRPADSGVKLFGREAWVHEQWLEPVPTGEPRFKVGDRVRTNAIYAEAAVLGITGHFVVDAVVQNIERCGLAAGWRVALYDRKEVLREVWLEKVPQVEKPASPPPVEAPAPISSNAKCLRCGAPSFTGLFSTTCMRPGGCATAEERVAKREAVLVGDMHRVRGEARTRFEGLWFPSEALALADWRERALAEERSR